MKKTLLYIFFFIVFQILVTKNVLAVDSACCKQPADITIVCNGKSYCLTDELATPSCSNLGPGYQAEMCHETQECRSGGSLGWGKCVAKPAQSGCCSSGHYEKQGSYEGCCQLPGTCVGGNSYGFDNSKLICGPTQSCSVDTQTCVIATKTPDCPQGTAPDAFDSTMCCTDWLPGNPSCLISEVCYHAVCKLGTPRVPRDNCTPTSKTRFEYDKTSGICIAVKPTPVWLCFDSSCETALGDIKTDIGGLIAFILQYALMLTGVVIILVLIAIGYRVLTSAGNPEKIQSAKELATSLVGGVLLIIFSLVILKAIGVNILGLPTFQ